MRGLGWVSPKEGRWIGDREVVSCSSARRLRCDADVGDVGDVGAITPASPSSSHPSRGHRSRTCPCRAPTASASLRVPARGPFGRRPARRHGDDPGRVHRVSSAPPTAAATGPGASIPPIVPAGEYRVVAGCGADAYAPQPFTVLPGEPRRCRCRRPRERRAPTSTSRWRARCVEERTRASTSVSSIRRSRLPTSSWLGVSVTPGAAGTWTTQVTIPAGTPARSCRIGVQCLLGGNQFFLYLPPPTIVLNLVARRASPARGDAPRRTELSRCPWTAWT